MFDFLKRKARDYFAATMEKELKTFIQSLQGMDGEELGLIVATSTHFRNKFCAEFDEE